MAEESKRRRWWLAALGLVLLVVVGSTWLASDRSSVYDVGVSPEVLIINDAGPVRVRSLESYDGDDEVVSGGVIVRSSESWLLRGPRIEMLTEGDASAFRITCPSRLPCRASVEVFVPAGVALSIVAANDLVQVDAFDGAMSIFAGDGGVVLGTVAGSVSITSNGSVTGTSLGPSELTIAVVEGDVSLAYLDAPTVLAVRSGDGTVSVELPPDEDYAIDVQADESTIGVESDAAADRLVSVRSDGSVSIQPYDSNEDS